MSASDFQALLKAAITLTDTQDLNDPMSVDVALDLWRYIDACRENYPELKKVYVSYP